MVPLITVIHYSEHVTGLWRLTVLQMIYLTSNHANTTVRIPVKYQIWVLKWTGGLPIRCGGSRFVRLDLPDPDPLIIKQKNTLISILLWLLYDFLSLKNDVNVFYKKRKKNQEKIIFKKNILKVTDGKSRIRIGIRISKSVVRIPGSGSVSKCYGFTTLPVPIHWSPR
jgi:hypothetical protein